MKQTECLTQIRISKTEFCLGETLYLNLMIDNRNCKANVSSAKVRIKQTINGASDKEDAQRIERSEVSYLLNIKDEQCSVPKGQQKNYHMPITIPADLPPSIIGKLVDVRHELQIFMKISATSKMVTEPRSANGVSPFLEGNDSGWQSLELC